MKTRDIFIGFILIIAIFYSYYSLKPIGQSHPITKNDYSLKTHNIKKDNKWSQFREEKNGTFFIHPGEEKTSVGVFKFKNAYDISLDFWIKKGSKVGNVEFNITKNGIPIDSIVVTPKNKKHILTNVSEEDVIKIKADKHGGIGQDWGQLKINAQETLLTLKNFVIPFLWSILLIFLLGKRHKYVAIASYLLFLLMVFSEKVNFGSLLFQNVLAYTIFIFALTFTFVLIYQELWKLKKFKIATIFSFTTAFLVYIIPLFFIIYALNFDDKVTKDILFAVFQSNSDESYEYISDYISSIYIFSFIAFTSIVAFLLYRQERKETVIIEKSLLIFIIIAFFSISLTQFSQLRLLDFFINNANTYNKELKLFKYTQEKRKAGDIKFKASKIEKGETYIIVIGESLNKKHMGIYGYLRDTTPFLTQIKEQNKLLLFHNTYSNHTHTVPVLSKALTESNQYNKKSYDDSISIIEILKKAKVENYWLTNQTIYGAWDNMVSVIGTSSDHLIAMNKHIGTQTNTDKLDGALIDEVKKILNQKTDKTRVIFVHLIGNHGSYSSRYPHDTFTIFKGPLKIGEYGTEISKNKNINDYDNSIVYNDYVVSSILKELQKEKGVTAFLYMSDHADDVIAKLGHNSGKFTYEMTQIPMIAWFSDEYKNRYSVKYNQLKKRTETLFSNDMFYDTLIGLFNIQTDKYNLKYDFTSSKYSLKPKDALTLKGKKHYADKNNYIYWQTVNAKYLINTNQSARIFPHRVNSVGKLHDIWNDGLHSFEVDVKFGDNNTTTFQMGHNHGVMGIELETFLLSIDYSKIERIWLDFKNLNVNNYKLALERLEYLNKKFDIKRKFIVESGSTAEFFKELREAGWHTSYYMPTEKIVKLLKGNTITAMKDLANKIANQTKLQNVSAVSFDNRLYPFIKKYLEPLIDKNIVYHIWYAPALEDSNFKEKLLSNKMYLDDRVKTLLTTYKSQFNL